MHALPCVQYAEDMAEKGGKDARKELDLLTTLLVIPSKSQQVLISVYNVIYHFIRLYNVIIGYFRLYNVI